MRGEETEGTMIPNIFQTKTVRLFFTFILACIFSRSAFAAHGVSIDGILKYPADFKNSITHPTRRLKEENWFFIPWEVLTK